MPKNKTNLKNDMNCLEVLSKPRSRFGDWRCKGNGFYRISLQMVGTFFDTVDRISEPEASLRLSYFNTLPASLPQPN